jgi:hypothetical protein
MSTTNKVLHGAYDKRTIAIEHIFLLHYVGGMRSVSSEVARKAEQHVKYDLKWLRHFSVDGAGPNVGSNGRGVLEMTKYAAKKSGSHSTLLNRVREGQKRLATAQMSWKPTKWSVRQSGHMETSSVLCAEGNFY